MEENKSASEKLMDRIQQQAIIRGIKEGFKRYPQARFLLPLINDGVNKAHADVLEYLGDSEKCIVIGAKKGIISAIVFDCNKKFSVSTGLKIMAEPNAIIFNKTADEYLQKLKSSGLFDDITDKDRELMNQIQDKGIQNVFNKEIKQIQQVVSSPVDNTQKTDETVPTVDEIKQIIQALCDAQNLLCDLGDIYDLCPDSDNINRLEITRKWAEAFKIERNTQLEPWKENKTETQR